MQKQFITDSKGKKVSVIVPIEEYNDMIEKLEELEDIKLYDEVKGRKEETIPFEEYLRKRKNKSA